MLTFSPTASSAKPDILPNSARAEAHHQLANVLPGTTTGLAFYYCTERKYTVVLEMIMVLVCLSKGVPTQSQEHNLSRSSKVLIVLFKYKMITGF